MHVLHAVLTATLISAGCAPRPRAQAGSVAQTSASDGGRSNDAGPLVPASMPQPTSRPVGCWEKVLGDPPDAEAMKPPITSPVPGCPECNELRVGPKAAGLHPEVLKKLRALEATLPPPKLSEPVMWLNSGKRDGSADESMHHQGLAIDLVICGLKSTQTAEHLRRVGFTCVTEYHDAAGAPCNMAHGDLRGTRWARGAYGRGGWKSRRCPRRAVAKTSECGSMRSDWRYE